MKKSLLMAALLSAVAAHALWIGEPIAEPPPKQPWTSGETTVTLSDDGTLTVGGNGAMGDYPEASWITQNRPPWRRNVPRGVAPQITAVVIEDGVTHIGENAFLNIESITVAPNNTHYNSEDGVLFNKDKTTLILYPTNRQQNVYTIPNNVTTIGKQAFFYCNNLASVIIPNSVTIIEERAFSRFRAAYYMKEGTLYDSSQISITIPNSVANIGERAFSESGLTSISIPGNVKIIRKRTFEMCDRLTSVTIGAGVTTIGASAFTNCKSLTSVTIPKSVTSVEESAFIACMNLTSVTVLNPRPPVLGSDAFLNTCAYNLYVPARSYFAYRADGDWGNEFDIKVIVTAYEVIALGILSALLLSAAVFVIVKKSRKAKASPAPCGQAAA